jgi:hypothetical protein
MLKSLGQESPRVHAGEDVNSWFKSSILDLDI